MPGKQHRKKKSGAKAAKRKGAEKKKGSAAVSDEQARWGDRWMADGGALGFWKRSIWVV